MQVDDPLRCPISAARLAMMEDVREEIAKSGRIGAVDADREIEALEPEGRGALVLRGRSGRVVTPAAFGIAQRLVRFRDLTELGGRHPVTGIDVRMVFPRKALVRALDVGKRGRPLQSEEDV